MDEELKGNVLRGMRWWWRPINSLVWTASGLACLGLVVALWVKYVGAGSMELVISKDTWLKFEVPRDGPHHVEVIHDYMSEEGIREDVVAILENFYGIYDLGDPENVKHVADMEYDHPFRRTLRREMASDMRNWWVRPELVSVKYSENVPVGNASVCKDSEFFGNRVRLLVRSRRSRTIVLEGRYVLEHEDCEKNVNGQIMLSTTDGDVLNMKHDGIDAQVLPRGFEEVPMLPVGAAASNSGKGNNNS